MSDMSENRKGTFLKQCQKCHIGINRDMLDAWGVCPRCRAKPKEEQKKNQNKRDSLPCNVNEGMETEPAYSDFISCDRSGRRNAVHDLRGDAGSLKLEKLASTVSAISITGEEDVVDICDTKKKCVLTSESEESHSNL